jgi:hypothetical protein
MDAPGVNGGSMRICVDMLEMEETIKPRNFRIRAEPSCTIYEIKKEIQDSEGIPPGRQCLFFGEQQQEDGRILSDYGSPIRNLSLLHTQNDHGETWNPIERADRTEPTKETPVSGSLVSEPGEKDIICGPAGKGLWEGMGCACSILAHFLVSTNFRLPAVSQGFSIGHVGNHVYRAIVEFESPRYRESSTQGEKSAIVARLVEFFRRRESRFLVADSMISGWMNTGWLELGQQDVVRKVQESLRDASHSHLFSQSQAEAGPAVEIIVTEMKEGAPWVAVPAANHDPPPGEREYLQGDYLLGNHGGMRACEYSPSLFLLLLSGPHYFLRLFSFTGTQPLQTRIPATSGFELRSWHEGQNTSHARRTRRAHSLKQ